MSLPLSLEWHVWFSSSGNNCHAVHKSLSSGASVCECTVGFYFIPFCQPSSPTPMEYALRPSLGWHVWPGRRSIYNRCFKPQTVDISYEKMWMCLRKKNLKRETDSLLIAAQNNAIRTSHIKARINKTHLNSKCRLCGDRDETINHLISECSKLA